jgi:hypothetical protein
MFGDVPEPMAVEGTAMPWLNGRLPCNQQRCGCNLQRRSGMAAAIHSCHDIMVETMVLGSVAEGVGS